MAPGAEVNEIAIDRGFGGDRLGRGIHPDDMAGGGVKTHRVAIDGGNVDAPLIHSRRTPDPTSGDGLFPDRRAGFGVDAVK